MTAMLVAAGTEPGAAAKLLGELYRRIQRAASSRPKALYMYPVFGCLVRKA
jgi:hypothetical protein